jgi:hypothetical protein
MSGSGQKRTLNRSIVMSALPPKADMDHHGRDVRFVPKAAVSSCRKTARLFYHLVGERKQRRRHLDAERLGCFEVDD